ncbi:MAG: hypothetical protein ACFHX7_00900 [Pseudomonadota bacterium]
MLAWLKLFPRWWLLLCLLGTGQGVFALSASDVINQGNLLAEEAQTTAMAGMTIPAGLFPAASLAQEVTDAFTPEELARVSSQVAGYLAELRLLAESPNAAGVTRLLTAGPLVAGSRHTITQVFEVPQTLGPGAAIRLGASAVSRQHEFPGEPGYVSLSADGVNFTASTLVDVGIAGSLQGPVAETVFEVTEGELRSGGRLTLSYQSLDVPVTAPMKLRLPLQVRFSPDAYWLHVPGDELLVVPGPAARLALRAPERVMTGSPFVVGLRLEDQFGNLAAGNLPSLEVLLNGAFVARVPAGADPTPVFNLTLDQAGPGDIQVRSSGGGLVADLRVEATSAVANLTRWPLLFIQTTLSGGRQAAAELIGSYANAADGILITENDAFLDDTAWQNRPAQSIDGFVRSANVRSGGQQVVLARDRVLLDGAPRRELPSPPALRAFVAESDALVVALPEVPTPAAMLDVRATRLVAIKAGDGTFEWYGNRLAAAGFRVGFVGSPFGHAPQVGRLATTGRTAVTLLPGESLFDGLLKRPTWVTSGPTISLDMQLNGTEPRGRATSSEMRQITGQVRGTAPIQTIELVRNGEVIAVRRYARNPASRRVKLTFFSSSEPLDGKTDVPRNGREWIGFLQVTGAEIASLDASNFRNRARQAATINPSLANRVDFITWTRGHPSSIDVDLAPTDTEDDTSVLLELSLAGGFEDAAQLGLGRPPAVIPPARMLFDLAELKAGPVIRQYPVSGYQDMVVADLVDPNVPREVDFEFVDRRESGEGDYYYVRVTQADDHMAWSSPVYVGGFDLR